MKLKLASGSLKKQRLSSKQAWKLLMSLIGFMILLGLSRVILLFTVVGTETNIYAAFVIQWLFVFFNSLQGFFISSSLSRSVLTCAISGNFIDFSLLQDHAKIISLQSRQPLHNL